MEMKLPSDLGGGSVPCAGGLRRHWSRAEKPVSSFWLLRGGGRGSQHHHHHHHHHRPWLLHCTGCCWCWDHSDFDFILFPRKRKKKQHVTDTVTHRLGFLTRWQRGKAMRAARERRCSSVWASSELGFNGTSGPAGFSQFFFISTVAVRDYTLGSFIKK